MTQFYLVSISIVTTLLSKSLTIEPCPKIISLIHKHLRFIVGSVLTLYFFNWTPQIFNIGNVNCEKNL